MTETKEWGQAVCLVPFFFSGASFGRLLSVICPKGDRKLRKRLVSATIRGCVWLNVPEG